MRSVVDHVIVCVPDLGEAVRRFEETHRVATVPGGRHGGHGTANRLIPLGESYIELVAVVERDEASTSAFGRWVAARSGDGGADGVALRTDDLDSVCRRLGLEPLAMSRTADTGEELQWRIAGMDEFVTFGLPFFIQWDIGPGLHPGRIPVQHPDGHRRLARVVVTGDVARLTDWVGDADGMGMGPGEPSVTFDLVRG